MHTTTVAELLEQLLRGDIDVAAAAARLSKDRPHSVLTESACVDIDRKRRCGFPEVVYAEGKSSASVVEILETLHQHEGNGLATRVSPDQAAAILTRFPESIYNPVARTIRLADHAADVPTLGRVPVVTAGTSDRPVAEEAVETLKWLHCDVDLIVDVGVAGPDRLQAQRARLAGSSAIVVVAGMEGALPSVVGGLVDCPVIAVPTSVGYGASFGGIAALLGMLNSCASNVTVVNIDAGFKAAYVAGVIARNASRKS